MKFLKAPEDFCHHLCEVQLHLDQFLALKGHSGHATYEVVRTLRLLDPIATNPPYTQITLSSLNNLRYGQVQTCDFTGIHISDDEAKLLADALKQEVASCMLKTLSLCKTKLTDSAALIIAASLSTHEDLYRLKLTGNPELSDKGASGEYRAEQAAYYTSLQENERRPRKSDFRFLRSSPLLFPCLLSIAIKIKTKRKYILHALTRRCALAHARGTALVMPLRKLGVALLNFCPKITTVTVRALAQSCPALEQLDLRDTATTPADAVFAAESFHLLEQLYFY